MGGTDSVLERGSLQVGLTVRDSRGKRLGYVALIGETVFFVRRYPFSLHWRAVRLAHLARLARGTVHLDAPGPEVLEPAEPHHSEILTHTLPLSRLPRPGSDAGSHA